jgi:hypothetical protein
MWMGIQRRLIAPRAVFLPDGQRTIPDTTALLWRLVLFDTYILQTIRFKEFIAASAAPHPVKQGNTGSTVHFHS